MCYSTNINFQMALMACLLFDQATHRMSKCNLSQLGHHNLDTVFTVVTVCMNMNDTVPQPPGWVAFKPLTPSWHIRNSS